MFAFTATCENFCAKTQFVSGLLRGNKDNMDEGLKYFTSYQIGNILKSFEDTTLKEKNEIIGRLEADYLATTKYGKETAIPIAKISHKISITSNIWEIKMKK